MSTRARRWLLRIGLGLPAAAVLGGLLGWLWLRRSLPELSGQLATPGISAGTSHVPSSEPPQSPFTT